MAFSSKLWRPITKNLFRRSMSIKATKASSIADQPAADSSFASATNECITHFNIRDLSDVEKAGDIHFSKNGQWESRRYFLEKHGLGFSMHQTILYPNTKTNIHYQNHTEGVFITGGSGEIHLMNDDKTVSRSYPLSPGTAYSLDKHENHVLEAGDDGLEVVCAFNPPLKGNEDHDENHVYHTVNTSLEVTETIKGKNITFETPKGEVGRIMHQIAVESDGLEENSVYCYSLMAKKFAHNGCIVAFDRTKENEEPRPVGFVLGFRPIDKANRYFVWQIGVCKHYQGMGIGKKLLFHLSHYLCNHGVRFLEATVTPSNAASIKLFTGFAKSIDVEWVKTDNYLTDLGENHEPEHLYTIGPFAMNNFYTNPDLIASPKMILTFAILFVVINAGDLDMQIVAPYTQICEQTLSNDSNVICHDYGVSQPFKQQTFPDFKLIEYTVQYSVAAYYPAALENNTLYQKYFINDSGASIVRSAFSWWQDVDTPATAVINYTQSGTVIQNQSCGDFRLVVIAEPSLYSDDYFHTDFVYRFNHSCNVVTNGEPTDDTDHPVNATKVFIIVGVVILVAFCCFVVFFAPNVRNSASSRPNAKDAYYQKMQAEQRAHERLAVHWHNAN